MAKILVVEDSAVDAEFIQRTLESLGHEVVCSATVPEGLEAAASAKPDLVFMDVVFDGMSGFQGARQIIRSSPETPVIFISRKGQQSDREWGLRQGARDYLIKPLSESQIHNAVNAVLGDVA